MNEWSESDWVDFLMLGGSPTAGAFSLLTSEARARGAMAAVKAIEAIEALKERARSDPKGALERLQGKAPSSPATDNATPIVPPSGEKDLKRSLILHQAAIRIAEGQGVPG